MMHVRFWPLWAVGHAVEIPRKAALRGDAAIICDK